MPGPLDGITVLDLTRLAPGPYCTMILGDMGADVIKIHNPTPPDGRRLEQAGGAEDRPIVPWRGDEADALDRNKRSMGLNLKDERAKEIFYALAKDADVVVEEMRPGVVERLGVDYETLRKLNKRIVYCSVTGFGQTGPYRLLAGHDLNYIALTGALHAIGTEDRPIPPLNLVGDFGGGALYLALGVTAALVEARTSGQGQVVDAAMVDGAASLMTGLYGFRAAGMMDDQRRHNALDGGAHFYDVYETRDGQHIALAPIEPRFYDTMLERLGLSSDELPRSTDPDEWPALKARLAAHIRTRTRDEWVERLEGTDACFAPVLNMAEAPEHPHLKARDTFVNRDGAWQPNAAPRFSRTPSAIRGAPAAPGGDTREVLGDWGLSPDEIAALLDAGVIAQRDPQGSA